MATPEQSTKAKLCVFNTARESFLSFGVTVADTHLSRLRGLLGRLRLHGDEGLWVVPCNGIHTVGMFFPIDLICLDAANRVIYFEEHVRPFRMVRPRMQCHSVLELPVRTIYNSHTKVGDELLIASQDEMQNYLEKRQSRASIPVAVTPNSRSHRFQERRCTPRIREPGLVVFYWEGGVPEPHRVVDVSDSGICIEAEMPWNRGTIVEMVLQRSGSEQSPDVITAQSFVVRTEKGTTGLAFMPTTKDQRRKFRSFLKRCSNGLMEQKATAPSQTSSVNFTCRLLRVSALRHLNAAGGKEPPWIDSVPAVAEVSY